MKRFFRKIIIFIVVVGLLAFALEKSFTTIYKYSKPRTKVQYIMSLENQNFDAIFIGSSRVENHIKTSLFKDNGFKVLNLGMSGANLNESLLVLKLLIARKITADKIFFQIDYNFEYQTPSKGITALFMPFLDDSIVSNHYSRNLKGYWKYKSIPFYKYVDNEAKIGLRELSMNILKKAPNVALEDGYKPLLNNLNNGKYHLPESVNNSNLVFFELEKIKNIADLNLIYFTAPFCKNTENLEYFNELKLKYIPSLYDYSRFIENNELFSSCGHLNDRGAEKFTREIINNFYEKE